MKFSDLKTKVKILIGVASPMALLLILGGISVYEINSIVKTNESVSHTYEVLSEAASVVGSAVDMETGMRGYLLAGKEGFLDPYKSGGKAAYEMIVKLKETVSDNPGQVARLGEIESTLKEWQSKVVEPTISLRREIGDAATMNDIAHLVGQAKGKVYFDKFRGQIATFVEREAKLLDTRRKDFETAFGNITNDLSKSEIDVAHMLENAKVLKQNENWVAHTYKVIAHAKSILAAAVDMETGMRGYLLAGKEGFLAPYTGGQKAFFELAGSLKETVSDNPAQVQLLTEAEETIRAWQKDVTEPTIALRRKIGDAKTMDDMADLVGEARGKVYFDKFRQIMADFAGEEAGLMAARKEANKETVSSTYTIITLCIIAALVIGLTLAMIIGNGVANPINSMTSAMGLLAEGDKSVEIPGQGRGDEIGDMASAVQVFKDNMIKADKLAEEQKEAEEAKQKRAQVVNNLIANFNKEVAGALGAMGTSATQMEDTSRSMSDTADDTASRAATVATASDQAANNVQTVATAAEELSSSVSEINRQVTESTRIGQEASKQAKKTDTMVNGLAEAVGKISDVVNLINDIADQTNLLALNATIEAARAGDAGKGFAVVASEVKNLATQTGKATEEIGGQISTVQTQTTEAVGAINQITDIINQMSEISAAIASAMEEQGAATAEIARNVQQAAAGTDEVRNNIVGVNQGAAQTGEAANGVLAAAQEVSQQTEQLREHVDTFLTRVQAA